MQPGISPIQTHILTGFDDPRLGPDAWARLLAEGDTDVISLTPQYLRAWWEALGEGELLLVLAERDRTPIALAPLVANGGMIYFAGTDSADYLDFIGNVRDPEILPALLAAARASVPGFLGFKFYFIPEQSGTAESLHRAAARLGLSGVLQGEIVSPVVDLRQRAEDVRTTLGRSMLKREQSFRARGALTITTVTEPDAMRSFLPEFYEQHGARWRAKGLPDEFADPRRRAFLERFLELAADTGWLRFLRIEWEGRFLAAEFAWYYKGTHFSAPWCFAMAEAKHSPGHVLLRQSLLAAVAEGLHSYDLGIGDQEYKFRLPVHTVNCQTWGLYPSD
jgi:CelD/BcsL family acetyltransferase involved in cellulose biosynthesis